MTLYTYKAARVDQLRDLKTHVTDGDDWNISGTLSEGGWKVGCTVSKHIRQVLEGQCFLGFGVVSAFVFGA